jgi:3-oxoadipate enol-lactonase
MKTVRVKGVNVGYVLDGPEDAPVVMFSNSLLTDRRMWSLQARSFAERFRVLRYDTRGHGDSDATKGPYTLPMLAQDVVDLLDALDISKVHFVGLSLGGFIGQHLGVMASGRLKSLVLCDTAVQVGPPSMWNDRIGLAESKGVSALVQPMTERWLTREFREANADFVRELGVMISGTKLEGFTGCCVAARDMDNHALLARIKIPSLVIVGDRDPGIPVSAAEVLHKGISGSEFKVITGAAHLPNVEQQQLFDKTVMDFIGRH